jgi:hypothetical protein
MNIVTNNDRGLAVASRARARALARARKPAEKGPHAVEKARWRCRGPVVGRRSRRGRSGAHGCLRRRGIHVPAKFDGRAQPHFAHEKDCFGRRVGWRFGRIGVKTERRHEHRIHRLSRGRGWGRRIFSSPALRRQRGSEGSDITRRLGMRGRGRGGRGGFNVGAWKIARTLGWVRLQRFNLPAGKAHRAALRNDHALVGKLRFHAHRAARGEHAHFTALLEAHSHIAGAT